MTSFLWRTICVLAVLALTEQRPTLISLNAGMVIDRSVTIRPGTHRLSASSDLTRPALTIRGENITIDFNGAVLAGGPDGAAPDGYAGVGILVDGGRKITVKNAVIRGYKVGILARRSPDLHLSHNDLSYNWKPRLYSGVEKESLVDWMSYHQNDKDEWLKQGAAIYLTECDRAEVDHSTAVQGQNGLMITRSSGLTIWNNTFQYISGRAIEDGVPRDRLALVAEGATRLPAGDYTLQVISDDGVRVWMDGAMILDEWAPLESTVRLVPIGGGARRFKVEYYDVTGFAELRFDIQRK